jgi:hypothetical protein
MTNNISTVEIIHDPDTKGGFSKGAVFTAYSAQMGLKDHRFTVGTQLMIRKKEGILKKTPGVYWVYDGEKSQVLLANQSEFQKAGRRILEQVGMIVYLMGDRRRSPPGMVGFPDMIAFAANQTALVEIKFGRDYMKKRQKEFKQLITPLTGPHLIYKIATTLQDFRDIAHAKKI